MPGDLDRPRKEVGPNQRHKEGSSRKKIKTRYLSPPEGKEGKGRKKNHKQKRISG